MSTEKQAKAKTSATTKCVIGFGIAVVVVWLFNLALMSVWTAEERGQFGDMFGASNALFSGLAFIGLIYAILLQRSELALQRIELKLTRKEMKGSREQLELQKQQMEIQNFENKFFQMVKIWMEIQIASSAAANEGKFGGFTNLMRMVDDSIMKAQSNKPEATDLHCINIGYCNTLVTRAASIKFYMRTLYNILKLVDRAKLGIDDKKFYSNIVRAQLSQPELVVIFYNGLSELGRDKFKPLIEKYSLLKHLDHYDLVSETHSKLYEPSAFAGSKPTVDPR